MLTNYHTHTKRCHHAFGEDEEYVLSAIKMGYGLLGFSDHVPYYYPDGYVSYYKMTPEEAPEYAESVFSLCEKYRDKIEIHMGFEAEYYPSLFEKSLPLWRELGAEYLILGQHFAGDEYPTREGSTAPSGKDKLTRYTDRCIAAMQTEKFSYIAHPDMLNYTEGDDAFYEHEVRRLIECANKYEMPLEINLLGLYEGRNYPNPKFWKIAATMNPRVIIGTDAHTPDTFERVGVRQKAVKMANDFGLKLIEKIEFKPI